MTMLVGDLPDAGQHPNRTIAFGPDGMLYISVGSTCNACNESNPENATLLRASPDGKSRTIFATGLRNTIGFGWHPTTGELWGMDHGIDSWATTMQPEELNQHRARQAVWLAPRLGRRRHHAADHPPGDIAKETWRHLSTPMVLGYTAHAAPMQMRVLHRRRLPGRVPGRCFRRHARLLEPRAALGLRGGARALRQRPAAAHSSPSSPAS